MARVGWCLLCSGVRIFVMGILLVFLSWWSLLGLVLTYLAPCCVWMGGEKAVFCVGMREGNVKRTRI